MEKSTSQKESANDLLLRGSADLGIEIQRVNKNRINAGV